MTQVTLSMPDNKLGLFLKMIEGANFIKIEQTKKNKKFTPTAEQLEWVDGLKSALNEVELHQQGKIELQSAREFLEELKEMA